MDKKLFDVVYRKYSKKDYFGTRQFIKNQIEALKVRGLTPSLSQIKAVLKNEKIKLYNMILNRIDTAKIKGKNIFPLRECFTHACFKAINL